MNLWDWTGAQTGRERIVFIGLALPFMVLIPVFLLLHGYIWTASGGTSSATLVYLMKLAPGLYALAAAVALGVSGLRAALRPVPVAIVGIVILIGLAVPFLFGRPPLFYYLADAIGLLATFAYILLTYQLLKEAPHLRAMIFKVMVAGAVITSLVVLTLYLWSRGNKVSIPPDIHYGIALGILLYLVSLADRFRVQIAPLVIMAGVGASQFRMNMLVAIGSILASWFWVIAFNRGGRFSWRAIEAALLVAIMVVPFSGAISETMGRFGLVVWNPMEAVATIRGGDGQILGEVSDKELQGRALDQRYVESYLVVQEVLRQPLSLVTGQGFGATFENTASAIATGGEREHSVHNSIAALLLRNGLIGVILFLIPAFAAVATAFRRERGLFISSVALLMIYLACMADQYVYWGGYFGIALAVWFHAWRHAPEEPEVV